MSVSKAKHLSAMVVGKECPSQIREPIIDRFIFDFLENKVTI